MPTPVVTGDKISVRGRAGGKHWTAAETAARQAGQEAAQRKSRVRLIPPSWLSAEALDVWKGIVRKLKGIELLDNLDTELLAVYCDAIVHYRECAAMMSMPVHRDDGEPPTPIDDLIKAMQAWSRIIVSYAEKLGLTPGGRARLAKRKAEKILDPFADSFGG